MVTVDTRFRIAQAIAVRGDRIVAVGSNADVFKQKGPNTKVIDVRGKTILPGLMDSHVHAVDASMYEFDHEIPTMETIADVLRYIRSRAAVVPKGEWICLSQVFITGFANNDIRHARNSIRLRRTCGDLCHRPRRLTEHPGA